MDASYPNQETIAIPVSPEVAESYRAMSEARREFLRRLLGMRLEEAVKGTGDDFVRLMDKAAREAKRKGLTPEILQQILDES
ncbi:MAG: hypothetical protein ACHQ50_00870 [Fimbriimonadales bacterium]